MKTTNHTVPAVSFRTVGTSMREGYTITHVQFQTECWTSPVLGIPANGTGPDRDPDPMLMAGLLKMAQGAYEASHDGSLSNCLIKGAVAAVRARYGWDD